MDAEAPGGFLGTATGWFRQYRIPLAVGGGALALVGISTILLVKSIQPTTPIEFTQGDIAGAASSTILLTVDVQGAVERPGVYDLPQGSRVEDALSQAGGLTGEADIERIAKTINRAAKLVDGAKLYVPKIGDSAASSGQNTAGAGTSAKSVPGAVSVNSASQAELEALPGIGPVTARKIIDNRLYQTLEELVGKKVLGQSLFNKLKDSLTL